MKSRVIIGIVALFVGIIMIGTSLFVGSYIEREMEKGIEAELVLDPEEMSETTSDFYIKEDDTKHYYFYDINDEEAVLAGTGGYDLVGPVRLSRTLHRLVLDIDDTAHTVTYVEFPTEITYYSPEDETLAATSVTMFNLNWFALHALNGEVAVLASVMAQTVAAMGGSEAAWNSVTGMGVNATQYNALTTGDFNVADPTTLGMLFEHPTYSTVLSASWNGVNETEQGLLATYLMTQYATTVQQTITGDGMVFITEHTIDDWLYGWDSVISGGTAEGLISGATYTDAQITAMTFEEMAYASNVEVFTIATGEDTVSNAYTIVADKGSTGLAWAPLVGDATGFDWTTFTPDDKAKIDTVWWPDVQKDDTLTLWDSFIGKGTVTYDEKTTVKGIDTYRFRKDEPKRDFTTAVSAKLSAQGDIYNPFDYYAGGYVWIDVEPTMGVGIRADKYFEFTINDHNSAGVVYKHFVVNERGELEDSDAREFKDTVYGAQELSEKVPMYGVISSVLVMLIGIAFIVVALKQ